MDILKFAVQYNTKESISLCLNKYNYGDKTIENPLCRALIFLINRNEGKLVHLLLQKQTFYYEDLLFLVTRGFETAFDQLMDYIDDIDIQKNIDIRDMFESLTKSVITHRCLKHNQKNVMSIFKTLICDSEITKMFVSYILKTLCVGFYVSKRGMWCNYKAVTIILDHRLNDIDKKTWKFLNLATDNPQHIFFRKFRKLKYQIYLSTIFKIEDVSDKLTEIELYNSISGIDDIPKNVIEEIHNSHWSSQD